MGCTIRGVVASDTAFDTCNNRVIAEEETRGCAVVNLPLNQIVLNLQPNDFKMTNIVNEPSEGSWGGPWTEKKLDAFIKYVKAYLTIMNKYHWKVIYFDGFAGSGDRWPKDENSLILEFDISEAETNLYHGAAERVIRLQRPFIFDYYYFIEKDINSLQNLEKKLKSIPESRDKNLVFKEGDFNKWLIELANAVKTKPKEFAALAFIDPFGMQVDWASIEQLKNTRTDVWVLIPTGVIVNRLLDRKGELKYVKKLESFFGLSELEIRERFYEKRVEKTLFDDEIEVVKKLSDPINRIAEIYIENMSKVWEYVTRPALRLDNSRGLPIFHFVFASNNPKALKIAKQIIQKS